MQKLNNTYFSLTYKKQKGLSAIWFEYNNQEWIVDPRALFNGMICSNNCNNPLLYRDTENLSQGKMSYFVKQEFNGDCFIWAFSQPLCTPECKKSFGYKEFLEKSTAALSELISDVKDGKATAYDGIIKTEELLKIFNQLNITKFFFMPERLRSSEIVKEKLSFICPALDKEEKEWDYDIPYILRIGNRETASYISHWSSDIDYIRHQLESYYYSGYTEIKLFFEDEPTIITLKRVSTLKSAETIEAGTLYNYDDFVKVTIEPNAFVKGAAIVGFCDERDTVKSLYEGLLNVGRIGFGFIPHDFNNPWNNDSIVFYNQVKSPIIERYIGDIKEKYNTIAERQRIVNHIFTICPDYTHVLGQMTNQSAVVEVFEDDIVTLYKQENSKEELCSVHLPGVFDWLDEFNRYSDGNQSNMRQMNVDEWHHRGLILAKELKKKLPKDIDVWYGYPYEDEKHRYDTPILITDGILKTYFEEELAKACLIKDRKRIDYCLDMDADINANDGAAFLNLIASKEDISTLTLEQLAIINKEKFELFEHLCTRGLIINHCKGGIERIYKLCKDWKCTLIEEKVREIENKY